MCLAVPGKVVSIDQDTAIIDYQGIQKEANISLTGCHIGDYVLVHVGFAIQVIDAERAKETYRLLDEIDERLNAQPTPK
ncbi:HypC/HybG/HupF family hydrogenase formation chaperone [Nanoarchaeota archaeon]